MGGIPPNIRDILHEKDIKIVETAINIVRKGEEQNIVLRILGAIAVVLHAGEFAQLYKKLGRLPEGENIFTDIDFIGYSAQRAKIRKFFEDFLKFSPDMHILLITGGKRLIYYSDDKNIHIDVFFDSLEFSHTISFGNKPGKGRLELCSPTISPTDIALGKLQIHQINEKDLIDLIVLFRSHEVAAQDEPDKINAKYIASILADDWGFWYDATTNLKKLKEYTLMRVKNGKLKEQDGQNTIQKINYLTETINSEPKTKKWKKREKIGTSKPWYRVVEEITR